MLTRRSVETRFSAQILPRQRQEPQTSQITAASARQVTENDKQWLLSVLICEICGSCL